MRNDGCSGLLERDHMRIRLDGCSVLSSATARNGPIRTKRSRKHKPFQLLSAAGRSIPGESSPVLVELRTTGYVFLGS